jgi:predicted phage tail component-like protein
MGFTFNSTTSQQMGVKARLVNWVASPALRNSFVQIPGKAGVADFGSDSAERVFTVKCNIYPQQSFTALAARLDAVAGWLDPANGLQRLVLDDVPDRFFMARLQDVLDCERLIRSAGAFELKFVCPNPHGYAITDEQFTITNTGSRAVTRAKGNTTSEPEYRLKATIPAGTGNQVTITTNGQQLAIGGPLASGETLIIDSELMTAKVVDANGATLRNGLPLLTELNFPTLRTGNNTITITATGSATFTQLQVQAKSRWR